MARLKAIAVVFVAYFAVAFLGGLGALNPSMKAEAAAMTAVLFLPVLLIALVVVWWLTAPDSTDQKSSGDDAPRS